MTNMLDYLVWRGDLSFDAAPFCTIDALLLARIAYLPFEKVCSDAFAEETTLLQAARKLAQEKIPVGFKKDGDLIRAMIRSERFRNCRICGCRAVFDPETQSQFAAMTFHPCEGIIYLAFRGTDDTLVGWKEDFNMTFAFPVPGQLRALDYLQECSDAIADDRLMLGGHSKGGNLAIYAASFCEEELQNRIEAVYNFDGPGFDRRLMQTEAYQSLAERVHTYVPQSSVIGQLLEHDEPYIIIHSEESGLMQHNLFTWEVVGTDFVPVESITKRGNFTDRTFRTWIEAMDDTQRANFFDGMYQLLTDADLLSIKYIREHWIESSRVLLKTARKMDPQTRKDVTFALKLLFRSAKQGAVDTFRSRNEEDAKHEQADPNALGN